MKSNTNNKYQLCFANCRAYLILLFILAAINIYTPIFADFDLQKYTDNSAIIATYPQNLISPPYLKKHNEFTFTNIKRCLFARLEFILGISPDLNSERCYKTQKYIMQSINAYQLRNNKKPLKYIDDNIIFNPESPIHRATITKQKISLNCSYVSCYDLSKDGFIYCKYHGAKIGSKAYKRYQKQIEANNKGIRPDDLVDIAIIIPLLLFPIITWLILMKVLNSTKKRQN